MRPLRTCAFGGSPSVAFRTSSKVFFPPSPHPCGNCARMSPGEPHHPLETSFLGASAPSGFAASLFNAQSGLAVHVVIVGGLFGFSDFLSIPIVFAPSDICLFLFIRLSRASFDREFSVGRAIRASCPRPTPAAQRRDSGPPSGSRSHTPADPLLRPVARRNG